VKNTPANNKKSPWLPLALALAVNAAMPLAFAGEAIHIRAQPLGQALSELGQQTSLQVFFSPDLVAGKQAPAVDGDISPEQALRQLLQGSGLDYQINEGSVTLIAGRDLRRRPMVTLELGVTDIKVVGDWLDDANAAVVQNHPGARTVVRREAMVEQGAMNVSDVLKRVPGVQVQDANGTGGSDISLNVGVRGLTSRLSPRSTVLIDGVPAAFAPYGQPQLSMAPISSGNLDSIDVVRGAGSVRYGPQNVGGVINFVTRAIPEQASGEIGTTLETSLSTVAGSTSTPHLLGGTADNGIGVALLYSGVNGNGYRERNNGNDIDDVMLKTHWAPTDYDDFSLNFHYYDATRRHARRPDSGAIRRRSIRVRCATTTNFSGRRKDVSFKWIAGNRRPYPSRSADLLFRQFPWQQHRRARPEDPRLVPAHLLHASASSHGCRMCSTSARPPRKSASVIAT
jgi:Fe(3+) dicitrate transport protein